MTNRENALAILGYENFTRVPVVHFGFWDETAAKWAAEGHLPTELIHGWAPNSPKEAEVARLLGFDFGWDPVVIGDAGLFPAFEREVLEEYPDGRIKVRNRSGALVLEKPGTVSIPAEVGHTLEDRASWDTLVEPRLRWTPDRIDRKGLSRELDLAAAGGPLTGSPDDKPRGLWCGSLYGTIRDMLGMENCAYLQVDDPELYEEIINRMGSLALTMVDESLNEADAMGVHFDFGHYWEDICFKNGPLIAPSTFDTLVGPWYRKIAERLARSGVHLASLDCDGMIDALLPTWINNGVNIMFPIEVGTWKASIAPWREKYGKAVHGVGGMEKLVFSRDRAAVDAEIERLKPLVDLGGFIPCPDHRIPPDAEWDNVRYYCDSFRKAFGS
jgi:uroporphyrinogen decarboxylase